MRTILLISPYWREKHRWMVSSYKLAELWQRMGYKVVVVCMSEKRIVKSEKGKVNKEEVSDTLTMYHVKDFFLKDPFNYGIAFKFLPTVLRVYKQEKPDIVVVNKVLYWSSIVLPFLRLIGAKPILTTDVLAGMTWWWRPWIARICGAIYAWTLGWIILLFASKVVFFHPQPEWLLRLLCISKKSRVIPTGIDETMYGRRELRTSDRDKIMITYVGRLESVKGVDDYLAAVDPLVDEQTSIYAQVVGWYPSTSSGHVDHPLVIRYEDNVTFTGLRNDIPAVMAETDIFVLPSYSEGLSNALMEAMASGCACIASEVGGNRFLLQDSVSGFLFPAGDRMMLRRHIERLIADPAKREALGRAARKRIEDVFSWKIVEKRYMELFEEMINC
jgi:glycosyltransferase involved in cell wall biosynthesis